MARPTAVITGCNSGLGFCFARLLIDEGWEVYATDVVVGGNLQSLNCITTHLDVTDAASIGVFKASFFASEHKPLDVLLNVAGVMEYPPQEDSLETLDMRKLERMFRVNTFGPVLLTQALRPNLLRSAQQQRRPAPRMAVISSRMAGMPYRTVGAGGHYAYYASKSAVNSLCKSMAMDLAASGVLVIMLHPGFVRTQLSPQLQQMREAREPEDAVRKLWPLLLSREREHINDLWHVDGYPIPQ